MEEEQRQHFQMQGTDGISFCPSFSSYSSHGIPEIAARVCDEFKGVSKFSAGKAPPEETSNDLDEDEDEDDDFEFDLVRSDPDGTQGEVFYNGQVRPIFPVFDRFLVRNDGEDRDRDRDAKADVKAIRIPLKNLFLEEREQREPPSSSSSEVDELESIPPGTYCVWRPKIVEASPGRCKKSSSTGSASKRWKLRDLLRRSNSEGKDSFVFLTPKSRERKSSINEKADNIKERGNSGDSVKVAAKAKAKGVARGEKSLPPPSPSPSPSAHEEFYVRNRALKAGDKKRSYLPYRKDLVGFFASVNGLTKTFPPF